MCIVEFVNVVKLAKVNLFHLYTNSYFFKDLVFGAFNSLIKPPNKMLPLRWWHNSTYPQKILGLKIGIQMFVVHMWSNEGSTIYVVH